MRPALVCALAGALLSTVSMAQEAPPGALSCTGCHGDQVDAALPLAGLSAKDIATALADVRSGSRESTLMGRIAKGFTSEEGEAIAKWLAEESK